MADERQSKLKPRREHFFDSLNAFIDGVPLEIVTWGRVLAVAYVLTMTLLGPLRERVFDKPFQRLNAEQRGNARAGWVSSETGRSEGAVYTLDESVADAMWGTMIAGDDAFTGEITISGKAPSGPAITIPVSGSTKTPNELKLRALDAEGNLLEEFRHPGADFDITVGRWDLRIPENSARLELVLVDGSTGHGAWLGVGRPAESDSGELDPLLGPMVNTGFFLAHVIAIAGFLFLPGLAIRAWWRRVKFSFGVLPVFGVALGAAAGLAVWLLSPVAGGLVAKVYLWLGVLCALVVLLREGPPIEDVERHSARLYALLATLVIVWSIVPLKVEHEFFAGTNARGRMVASPPDCWIPYQTAAYFLDAADGVVNPQPYFGEEWSVTSRGPLASWVIAAQMKVFNFKPHEPPLVVPHPWPADPEGYFVARIVGIFTNALVVFGALAALGGFAAGRRRVIWFGLGWLALSPVVMINTPFLWPKLLATYFGLLAIASVARKRRAFETGLWLALAYLSHPVGLLIAAPVALWAGVLAASGPKVFRVKVDLFFGRIGWMTLWTIVFALPWLVFKVIAGEADVFLRYPLGDGRGYETAASLRSWLECRWDNFVFSLVPGPLWQSNLLVQWTGGSISWPGHLAMNYQKVLTLGIGLAMAPIALWRMIRADTLAVRTFCLWALGAGFLFMVLIWGYNRDGLGRACLEPTIVFTIIAAAAARPTVGLVCRILLAVVALEQGMLLALAYVAAPEFAFESTSIAAWLWLGVSAAVWIALVWFALNPSPADDIEPGGRI